MITFKINGKTTTYDGDGNRPLLWYLRDNLNMTGTKYGCGVATCGACTVHMNGQAMRSCSLPMSSLQGAEITTIEGISGGIDSPAGKAVQRAWEKLDVVQCGYCQSGQVMSATALLANNPKPDDADIDQAMQGNLCRCATYHRIRTAIHQAAADLAKEV